MQTLDVISVNLWQILISLINLVLLFLIIKKFLYKPVRKVLKQRQDEIDNLYNEANTANASAQENMKLWDEKIKSAKSEADSIISDAAMKADLRKNDIISEAKQTAEGIIRQAENDAELERRKAEAEIKTEIVDVSAALAKKILEREININDHKEMIDSFVNNLGDEQ
ncbi:MAG: F0F1 ATP synthase subunit B [Clostridia bacterium]|nr:F0F1 ATP synthase subunit B [Clostridia bacterium]